MSFDHTVETLQTVLQKSNIEQEPTRELAKVI